MSSDWRPEIVLKDIDQLIPYIGNAKLHPDAQIDLIAGSIKEFGFVSPILLDNEGVIVAGHGRLLALKKLGHKEVPCIVADHLTPVQIKALRLADNKMAESKWDDKMLTVELLSLNEGGFDLSFAGFPDWREPEDKTENGPDADLDRLDEMADKWQTKLGQLWAVGKHRLCCGDSTEAKTYQSLLGDIRANLVVTDPPYGVDYVGKTNDALKMQNDGRDGIERMLSSSMILMKEYSRAGAVWYIAAPSGPQFYEFATVLRNLSIWRQTITWVKNTLVMGHSDFHYRHEVLFYGWTEGPHLAPRDRKQDTVWEIDRPTASKEHPTMKPVALYVKAIHNSSRKGDIVLDMFAGSGTAFVAAEQTGRICYGCELDPRYAAVILERMSKMGIESELM